MKFDAFLKILITGIIVLSILTIVSLIPIVTRSSISLLPGGVATFPDAAAFVPRQAPAMISILVNPEKLYGIRQASLPLDKRQSDRREWQQWLSENISKIGLDYQQLKPWLGDEITLAVTNLDYDRDPDNGLQAGYLFAVEARNTGLANKYLNNLYAQQDISVEEHKGANIIASAERPNSQTKIRASALVGNFVLFANQPQIIKAAVDRAQAVNLNLEQSEDYQQAIAQIQRPHLAIVYADLPQATAWLNKSAIVEQSSNSQILSGFLSIERSSLAVQTILTETNDAVANSQIYKSLLVNTELGKIIDFLPLEDDTYIDLSENISLLENRTPYAIVKLAIKELFPHLEAIAITKEGDLDKIDRTKIMFKLDA